MVLSICRFAVSRTVSYRRSAMHVLLLVLTSLPLCLVNAIDSAEMMPSVCAVKFALAVNVVKIRAVAVIRVLTNQSAVVEMV